MLATQRPLLLRGLHISMWTLQRARRGGAEAEAQPPFSRKMTTAVAIADCAGAVPLHAPLVLTMAAMILRLWVYAQVVYIHGYAS